MTDSLANKRLTRIFNSVKESFDREPRGKEDGIRQYQAGRVLRVNEGVVTIEGLPDVLSEEVLDFESGARALALNLAPDHIQAVAIRDSDSIQAGDSVYPSGRIMDVPVGSGLKGRVIDPTGRPLDGKSAPAAEARRPIEREAPTIMDRSPVTQPLQTGIQAIDALIPIGRGQRELILGDRQTGKSAIALDTVINQKNSDVISIYCSIGKRKAEIAMMVDDLERYGVLDKTIVVAASGDNDPGMLFAAPYAATAIGEYFMDRGEHALVVYDDLTRHARAYREISLLLRRPPAREAYPGDIFYIHSRLLERATHLNKDSGGGTLTALPIIETQEGNVSAYIPTNLISITDGQILLSSKLYQQGQLPAIDVGKSVSRVGGKTQLPAYRAVSGDLKLSYSQYEELEGFSRFGVTLDEETSKTLERGRRVRRALKQDQYKPMNVTGQIALLVAVNEGVFDDRDFSQIDRVRETIGRFSDENLAQFEGEISQGEKLDADDTQTIAGLVRNHYFSDRENESNTQTGEAEEQQPEND